MVGARYTRSRLAPAAGTCLSHAGILATLMPLRSTRRSPVFQVRATSYQVSPAPAAGTCLSHAGILATLMPLRPTRRSPWRVIQVTNPPSNILNLYLLHHDRSRARGAGKFVSLTSFPSIGRSHWVNITARCLCLRSYASTSYVTVMTRSTSAPRTSGSCGMEVITIASVHVRPGTRHRCELILILMCSNSPASSIDRLDPRNLWSG